jgi:hypothetical protein
LKKLGSDLGNCLGSTAINGYLDGRYTVNALIGSDGKAIGCFEIDIANRITQAKARRNEELPAELAHVLADFLAELGFNERELRRRVLTASQQQLAQVNDDAAALEFGRRVAALAIPG